MPTILVTGGTGMIGKAIIEILLQKGYKVIVLTRKLPVNPGPSVSYATWDINTQTIDQEAIAAADHIIHLAGAGVAEKRWSDKRKKEIVDSRIKSGDLLVKAVNEIPNHIQSIISASAIGWYGPDPVVPNPNPFTEDKPANNDFLGQTCLQWEKSLDPLRSVKRVVTFRIGIVLSNEGGVIKEFTRPLNFGIASILGSGKQIMSWVHINDVARLFVNAIENKNLQGVYNAVAPRPVSSKELVLRLARSRRGKLFIPIHVPSLVLKLMLGEMSIEVLKSATVSDEKIKRAGFIFQYPALESIKSY